MMHWIFTKKLENILELIMVESWMPITANILLFLMGLIFTAGGANVPSRLLGAACVVVSVLSLFANLGLI